MQTTLNEYGPAGWELMLIGMGDMTTLAIGIQEIAAD